MYLVLNITICTNIINFLISRSVNWVTYFLFSFPFSRSIYVFLYRFLFLAPLLKFHVLWDLILDSTASNQDFRIIMLTTTRWGHRQKWREKQSWSWRPIRAAMGSFDHGPRCHRLKPIFWSMTLTTTHKGHGQKWSPKQGWSCRPRETVLHAPCMYLGGTGQTKMTSAT